MKLSLNKALNLASYHLKNGDVKKAEQLYNSVLKVAPGNKTAQSGLRAINSLRHVTSVQSNEAGLVTRLCNLYNNSEMAQAIKIADTLIASNPDQPVAWSVLGAAKLALGLNDEAEAAFLKLKILLPNDASVNNNLASVLMGNQKHGEAIEHFRAAIKIKDDLLEAYIGLSFCLHVLNRHDDALCSIGKALELNPDDAHALNVLGLIKAGQGMTEEASKAYRKAIAGKSLCADAHRHLSQLTKYQPGNSHIVQVEKLLSSAELTRHQSCQLNYTYAKMKEDLGEFDQAFRYYQAAGMLRKQMNRYDIRDDALFFNRIKQHAVKLIEARNYDWKEEKSNRIPIFIVGMPRSGTSLVEQIISNHSNVTAGGELPFLGEGGKQLVQKGILDTNNLKNFRDHYLNRLNEMSSGGKFVTDKMPHNFRYLGIIRAAFPEAKIVHVTRDAGAVCWSNFQQYFSAPELSYSFDIDDVVNYYGLYVDLIKFYKKLLPGVMYEVNYDQMTCEPEEHIRALINNLTLSWEAACLSPHENKRIVATASREQVRREIYTGSSQRWRKFEPYLNGAFDVLYVS